MSPYFLRRDRLPPISASRETPRLVDFAHAFNEEPRGLTDKFAGCRPIGSLIGNAFRGIRSVAREPLTLQSTRVPFSGHCSLRDVAIDAIASLDCALEYCSIPLTWSRQKTGASGPLPSLLGIERIR